jgi:hypothetical protein
MQDTEQHQTGEMAAKDSSPYPDLAGEPYIQVLDRLHRELRPQSYFEIGTYHGESLAIAHCPSIAVDPDFQIQNPRTVTNKPFCALYRQPSDAFFASVDPSAVFGRKIELAFLDGMRRCEFLLRDFANTEGFCKPTRALTTSDEISARFWL